MKHITDLDIVKVQRPVRVVQFGEATSCVHLLIT